ncbi:hypothetical protein HN858_01470 [Candidatus Falkowbacteria bacterium]|jgi:hypothetical protein|nr:hypothetical protein [Candidatus Falkowbacteria bacterium]MBT7993231.1 hypothetical protein [bacterium]MBT5503158.1 hypothetical protein [Candidatus Falkowbacteria bacterium]MBT6574546.1 hypothetical protein [Candidatus Falkowbacteria bacterium]MBT7348323.1 hypothetical protein [Candidatus Falkowbacteria bacterium]
MTKEQDVQLREKEKIVQVVYHHPIVIIPHLIICFLILVLNFFLMYYLFLQGWWGAILFLGIIVSVVFYILRLIFLYRKNRFVITNQRVIDYEQVGFFERFINEFPYSKIKQANAVIRGLGPTIFRYGNLKLILKEDVGPVELYKISKPLKLQSLISEYLHKSEQFSVGSECTDPVGLIMAEIQLLKRSDKIRIFRQVKEELRKSSPQTELQNKNQL